MPVDDNPFLVRLAVVDQEASLTGLDELGAAPGVQPDDELVVVEHREALTGRLEQRRVVGAGRQLDVEAAGEPARERFEDPCGVLCLGHSADPIPMRAFLRPPRAPS